MKHKIYTSIALLSLLLVSMGLQAQTTSTIPPDAGKHASSENYSEGDIYYVEQLLSGEYTGLMFDVEGNEYLVATFGGTWWMTWNMRSIRYSSTAHANANMEINGGVPSATTVTTEAQFCFPQSASGIILPKHTANWAKSQGVLYNYKATVNKDIGNVNEGNTAHEVRQGICPTGWHVPSDMELTVFTDALGGLPVAGAKLKSLTRLAGSTNAITNASSASADMGGFDLLLAGYAANGSAMSYGGTVYLWSSSSNGIHYALIRNVLSGNANMSSSLINRYLFASVRCKKN